MKKFNALQIFQKKNAHERSLYNFLQKKFAGR